MTKTAPHPGSVTGLVPAQRLPEGSGAARSATGRPAARALGVLLGLRRLRPVPAGAQEPYGESDGQ